MNTESIRRASSAILLLLFYLVAGMLLLEGGIRLARAAPPAEPPGFFWRAPDPTTGWSLQPGASGRWYNPLYEYDTWVEINSRGLRVPESIDYDKPEGVYRVLVLGDSFVEATQVELPESFPQRLAHLLQESGLAAEVLNAGVSGWGTDQQLLWLREEGHKYEPDLVLLAVYPRNDFMNNAEPLEVANFGSIQKPFFHLEAGELTLHYYPFDPAQVPATPAEEPSPSQPAAPGPLTGLGSWLHGQSALYRYLDPRIRLVAPDMAAGLGRLGLIEPGQESRIVAQGEGYIPLAYQVYRRPSLPEWEAAFVLSGALFEAVREAAQGMGAQAAALVLTAPEQVYVQEWQQVLSQYPAMQEYEWAPDLPRDRALDLLAEAALPTLDLLPLFRQNAGGDVPLHLADDGHWTPAGHALAAAGIFNFLSESGLVPQLQPATVPATVPGQPRTVWEWALLAILALLAVSVLWDLYRSGPVRWARKLATGLATGGELLAFLVRRRRFTLLPLVTILLLFGGLLVIAQASVVGPFIYTLF
jgi:lysophospholipase L1-like esterase